MTLLTIGLPVFAAVAFEWGFDRLRLAWEWRKAPRTFLKHSRQLDGARKKLEAKVEKRERRIAALNEQRKEWTNAYLQNHELGRVVGACQQPLWQVVVKIVAVTLLILMACLLLAPALSEHVISVVARTLIYALVTLGLGGLYAYHAIKAWDRPTPLQLYKQLATKWRKETKPDAFRQGSGRDESKPSAVVLEADALAGTVRSGS